jgi:uncharacterized protein YuzE
MTETVKYNTEDDILLIWFSDHDIADAQMIGSTIMHVGKDGEPVLLEILDASAFVGNLSAAIAAARDARDAA